MLNFLNDFHCVGHRGFRGLYPENTMLAFKKAADVGATMVELDVQLTKDDVVVVVHDISMERLSGDPRHVTDMTWKELSSQTITGEMGEIVQKGKSCTLEDLFKTLKKRVHYYVELKTSEQQPVEYKRLLCEKVLALVKKYGLLDSVMFASFEMQSVEEMRKISQGVPVGLNVRGVLPSEVTLTALEKMGAAICPDQNLLDEKVIRAYKERGFRLMPWGVNEVDRMKQLMQWGIDAITTDYPNRLCELLKK